MLKRRPPSLLSGRGGRCGVHTFTEPSFWRISGRPWRIKVSSASAVAFTPSASVLMGGGLAACATIEGIVRRRLQAGGGADAAFTAVDRGIEQIGQRRPNRQDLGAVGFGFRGVARPFWPAGCLRHLPNM